MLRVQTTGGRNGYGAKLANIYSTEFVVETADGARSKRRYKQVFKNNMGVIGEARISDCGAGDNWTKVLVVIATAPCLLMMSFPDPDESLCHITRVLQPTLPLQTVTGPICGSLVSAASKVGPRTIGALCSDAQR